MGLKILVSLVRFPVVPHKIIAIYSNVSRYFNLQGTRFTHIAFFVSFASTGGLPAARNPELAYP